MITFEHDNVGSWQYVSASLVQVVVQNRLLHNHPDGYGQMHRGGELPWWHDIDPHYQDVRSPDDLNQADSAWNSTGFLPPPRDTDTYKSSIELDATSPKTQQRMYESMYLVLVSVYKRPKRTELDSSLSRKRVKSIITNYRRAHVQLTIAR